MNNSLYIHISQPGKQCFPYSWYRWGHTMRHLPERLFCRSRRNSSGYYNAMTRNTLSGSGETDADAEVSHKATGHCHYREPKIPPTKIPPSENSTQRKFHPAKFHPAKIPPSENSTQRKLG